jgi:beta-lactam-binding protein with PASTA domain
MDGKENLLKRGARPAIWLVVGAALASLMFAFGGGTPRRHVPRVLGESKASAIAHMARHDLLAEVVVDRSARGRLPKRSAGTVVQQTWAHGMALPEGSSVRVTIYPHPNRKHR